VDHVHERPLDANDAVDPRPRSAVPWRASNPDRWSILGLADPDPAGRLPKGGGVADLLARAAVLPGSADPVQGIVDAVTSELVTLAEYLPDRKTADTLRMFAGRLEAAMQLLRWADNREEMPKEEEPEDDLKETRDAAPDDPHRPA
jgi:hypothetical protein